MISQDKYQEEECSHFCFSLTNDVKSDIDEHPVHGVLHLKAFEEDVRLEQPDDLGKIVDKALVSVSE